MKKLFALLLGLSIFLLAPHAFASAVNSCAAIEDINNDLTADYSLGSDLDCSSEGNSIMIGSTTSPFTGTFDGQGHKITVNIIDPTSNYRGLFIKTSGATISNVWISGNIQGSSSVGTLIGWALNSTISKIKSDAHASSSGSTGGIVGYAVGSAIQDSYFQGIVVGAGSTGGIVGQADFGLVRRTYSIGTITTTGSDWDAGGIVGYGNGVGITHNFSTGPITSNSSGGILGTSIAATVIVDSFDSTTTSAVRCVGSDGGISCTLHPSDYFKSSSSSDIFISEWDFNSIWAVRDGDYPGLQIFGETDSIPDTTAPSVVITYPTSTSTVSGASVTLSASSSDDVAVAGVQFYIAGVEVGSEDTVSPYSVSWDSTTASSGPHTIYAVARDTSDNYRTSLYVIFTSDNIAPDITDIDTTATRQGATIVWTTDENTSSQVVYSTDTSYSSITDITNTSPRVSSHSATLSSLHGCTTYNFKVVSTDGYSNTATSSAQSFKTTGCGHRSIIESIPTSTMSISNNTIQVIVATDTDIFPTSTPVLNLLPAKTFQFIHRLKVGSSGEDVRLLQIFLNTHGFPVAKTGSGSLGNETIFFQGKTKTALIKFQEAHAQDILVPQRLKNGSGNFFSSTMNFVNTTLSEGK